MKRLTIHRLFYTVFHLAPGRSSVGCSRKAGRRFFCEFPCKQRAVRIKSLIFYIENLRRNSSACSRRKICKETRRHNSEGTHLYRRIAQTPFGCSRPPQGDD